MNFGKYLLTMCTGFRCNEVLQMFPVVGDAFKHFESINGIVIRIQSFAKLLFLLLQFVKFTANTNKVQMVKVKVKIKVFFPRSEDANTDKSLKWIFGIWEKQCN